VSDPLFPFYERELAILRQRAAEFAEEHPKIAARLSLGRDESQDPHVERLLQGVAFLNARLHKRLEDDFPELSDTLLDLLYPHYLRPVPSMSIVEMRIDPKQAALINGHRVPRGTMLETEPVDGGPCLYRTCFDLQLWPLQLTAARFAVAPFDLPVVPPPQTESILQIDLASLLPSVPIGSMPLDSLRFHLHVGAGQPIFRLYELLLTKCLGVVVSDPAEGEGATILPPTRIAAAGFDRDDAALPSDSRSFPGYRLLSEMFALPQKFLFVELGGLHGSAAARAGTGLRLSFLLTETDRELERLVTAAAVRLGCTPVVNLFPHRLDPLRLSGTQSEYCLVPDVRRPAGFEIHSLRGVRAGRPGERPRSVLPLYAPAGGGGDNPLLATDDGGRDAGLRYVAARRMRREPMPDGSFDGGSDLWLSLVDAAGGPAAVNGLTLHADAWCTNRNLTNLLPFAVGRPRLTLRDGDGPVGMISCLTRPTRPLRHRPGRGAAWRLISHLALNHLSLVEGAGGRGPEALRQMLSLYLHEDLEDFGQKQRWIQGITGISGRRVAARVPGPGGGVAQGLEVRLHLDEDRFGDHAAYLFASVLDRFFAAHVTINSFTRLVAASRKQDSRQEPWRWPPRAGNRVLA
jgi:type VI secretion system protein ImpG